MLTSDDHAVEIGKVNSLEVLKEVDFGIYLDGGDEGGILMPARYVPKKTQVGQSLDAFIYRDSEDRLIATTETPKVMVGQCAYLKVSAVERVGAFLDWGLPKDLLAPFNQQSVPMEQGYSYVVYAYLDRKTGRIAASSKLNHYLEESGDGFRVGQQVDLMIVSRSDLGFKAVIDGTHLGLIFHDEVTKPLKFGQKLTGYIKQIRPGDKRIDLALEQGRALTRKDLNKQILEYLKANQGVSLITDKSPPDQILQQFGVSKGNFKKALGALYKEKKILIEADKVTLVE
ncbi:MAG: CvfB family protein [bacterium]